MTRLILLALPLLASVTQAARLRHDALHREGAIFRRQLECDIGYKPCSDGEGCCEIGETCTSSRGIPICAGGDCAPGVMTCTGGGVTACCQKVGEVCDEDRPGFCTAETGGNDPTVTYPPTLTLTSDVEPTETTSVVEPTTETTVQTLTLDDPTLTSPTSTPGITPGPEPTDGPGDDDDDDDGTDPGDDTDGGDDADGGDDNNSGEDTEAAPEPSVPPEGAASLVRGSLGAAVAACAGLVFWVL